MHFTAPARAAAGALAAVLFAWSFSAHAMGGSAPSAGSADASIVTYRGEAAGPVARFFRPSPLLDPAERKRRIEAHRPPSLGAPAGSLVPENVRRATTARWAETLETFAAYDEARDAYARAIGLGARDLATWRGLGRTRVRTGQLDAGEAALLAALELLDTGTGPATDSDPVSAAALHRELGELYLLVRQHDDAVRALETALELSPGEARTAKLLARAERALAGPSSSEGGAPEDPADAEAIELWPPAGLSRYTQAIEAPLRRLEASLPALLQRTMNATLTRDGRLRGLAIAGALFALAVLLRVFRGQGDLVVALEYPTDFRGTFSVRIATQQGRHKRQRSAEAPNPHSKPISSRTEHHLVSRETHFRRLRPGRYWVTVEGILQNTESDEVVSDPFEEQVVAVERRGTVRLEFDVGPRECPIDVKVLWDKRPARDAGIVALGQPETLRYARGGATRLRLPIGSHTVVVGCGDRVAEHRIDVLSFQPTSAVIDLGSADCVLFKGCPPAVEPYLHGDLNGAARALQRDGQDELANLLLAGLHREQGHTQRAAEHYEAAGLLHEAAELYASLDQHAHAAELFEKADDVKRAAEMYCAAEDWVRAGAAWESAEDLERALDCYRRSGDTPAWIDALERHMRCFEAAGVALETGDRARAIRLLQLVGQTDVRYADACEQLADAFEHEGHSDLAAQKLKERIEASDPGEAWPDMQSRLANLHGKAGEYAKALQVLEDLRRREPTYPNVATRIEFFRKKRDGQTPQVTPSLSGSQSAPTAVISESRYQIIEEIGRGGMGVVYRARDRRLRREVALKRLPENLRENPKATQLFLREAQAAAGLNHPNIVTVYDTDQENGVFFITMELLEGLPLNAILRQRTSLTPRDVAKLGLQVAEGLHYAHERRIVHRDIKTANLFFTKERVVKIMDFGLAKMLEEVRRAATVIGGTPFYMAPEQSAGGAVDHRADIYALGVTFFELATGKVPFPDGDVTYHHRHTPPPDPRSLVPDLPDELAELILHMMEKEVHARCPSAADVAERLARVARSST